jgi:hypothetical protein
VYNDEEMRVSFVLLLYDKTVMGGINRITCRHEYVVLRSKVEQQASRKIPEFEIPRMYPARPS